MPIARTRYDIATIGLLLVGVLTTGCIERRLRADFTRADRTLLTSDAMHLVLCGTGIALADHKRAGPCTAVIAAGRFFWWTWDRVGGEAPMSPGFRSPTYTGYF